MTQPEKNDAAPDDFTPPGRLVIYGCGLLGGSVAKAVRAKGWKTEIIAFGRNEDRLKEMKSSGLIDGYTQENYDDIKEGDWILLCQPVEVIASFLPKLCAKLPANCVITDVGSTKSNIVSAAEGSKKGRASFVGSHPMAGSEKAGWRNSTATLFEGATTIVTPTDHTSPTLAAKVAGLWKALGSRVVVMAPKRHDEIVGMVSHLPHMAAAAMMEQIFQTGDDPSLIRLVSGNGLRDTTRIAMGHPTIWTQICMENSESIIRHLEMLADQLQEYARLIRDRDDKGLEEALFRASSMRQKIEKTDL